ncbi:MAG: DUF1772 domain-containing protein [Pseudorhodoplanes sp.]|nr:DUF1772 domain-containing protein [Pseudorhodoplanes sp.]
MLHVAQVLAVLFVSVTMALALAHALEFPGKMRLAKEQYLAVQQIYYPGFSIGGAAEPLSVLMTLILLFLTPPGAAFWLTASAFVALLVMHAAYWLLTHPVNNFWLQGTELSRAGRDFFSFDPLYRKSGSDPGDWTQLRDRWEYSHLVRAGLGLLSLILLVTAVAKS